MNPLEKVTAGMAGTQSVIVTSKLTVAHHKPGMPERLKAG